MLQGTFVVPICILYVRVIYFSFSKSMSFSSLVPSILHHRDQHHHHHPQALTCSPCSRLRRIYACLGCTSRQEITYILKTALKNEIQTRCLISCDLLYPIKPPTPTTMKNILKSTILRKNERKKMLEVFLKCNA